MKLLNQTIRLYLLYATIILFISIPVLYAAIQNVLAEETDESLIAQKEKMMTQLEKAGDLRLLISLENLDPDVRLIPSQTTIARKDTLYSITNYDPVSREKIPYRILESNISVNGSKYTLQLKNSLLDSEDLLESIVKTSTVLLFLIIAGMILINRILSKKIWKPFYDTIHQLEGFKIEENKVLQFEKNNITEFTELNRAISVLTDRNRSVFQSQKEFTENASHEMQTPLAILQGKLELLMQTNPLSREQSELISDLADVNQRMSHLNKSLLLLTKIENYQFGETETVLLKPVIAKLIEQYTFLAEQKNISIQNELSDDVQLTASKMLIEMLMGNLLSNAIRHNVEAGKVRIYSKGKEIVFENSGKLTGLDERKLFQRFQKQSADLSHTGLGLEIVKKVTEVCHFRIRYNFADGMHQFIISC